jgi:nitrate/nitrite transport system substrate-binding protein
MSDLYTEVANEMKVAIPADDLKPFATSIEPGAIFDPSKPAEYLKVCKK